MDPADGARERLACLAPGRCRFHMIGRRNSGCPNLPFRFMSGSCVVLSSGCAAFWNATLAHGVQGDPSLALADNDGDDVPERWMNSMYYTEPMSSPHHAVESDAERCRHVQRINEVGIGSMATIQFRQRVTLIPDQRTQPGPFIPCTEHISASCNRTNVRYRERAAWTWRESAPADNARKRRKGRRPDR